MNLLKPHPRVICEEDQLMKLFDNFKSKNKTKLTYQFILEPVTMKFEKVFVVFVFIALLSSVSGTYIPGMFFYFPSYT